MNTPIIELLHYLARGGVPHYKHRWGKENKQATRLQNFLSKVEERGGYGNAFR